MQTVGWWLAKSLLWQWVGVLRRTVLLSYASGWRGMQPRLFWTWLVLAWLAAALSIPGSFPVAASQTSGNRIPAAPASSEHFIAAFDLTPKGDFRFTWPPDSMRPASYETVMLVVEEMPQLRNAKRQNARLAKLRARDHLRINGQPPRLLPNVAEERQVETEGSAEFFLVKLDQGRLRIRLLIPRELSLDPLHNNARIRLYSHTGND